MSNSALFMLILLFSSLPALAQSDQGKWFLTLKVFSHTNRSMTPNLDGTYQVKAPFQSRSDCVAQVQAVQNAPGTIEDLSLDPPYELHGYGVAKVEGTCTVYRVAGIPELARPTCKEQMAYLQKILEAKRTPINPMINPALQPKNLEGETEVDLLQNKGLLELAEVGYLLIPAELRDEATDHALINTKETESQACQELQALAAKFRIRMRQLERTNPEDAAKIRAIRTPEGFARLKQEILAERRREEARCARYDNATQKLRCQMGIE